MASITRSRLALQRATRLQPIRCFSTTASRAAQAYFPNEPKAPSVQTSVPGPKSKAAGEELNEIFDTRSLNLLADYEKSVGN